MHECLVLHYLATDSAQGWENFLSQCIPNGNWMPATLRRAMLMNMLDKCHIAPSYRRMPHDWGSYSGQNMCHVFWRMPHVSARGTLGGIAPSVLLSRIPGAQGERLLLYHYTSDTLCQWKPGPDTLKALPEKLQESWDGIRDAIINGLVVGGNSSPPPEVTGLLSGFLRRLPLPRLVHFLDMIVPQMVPVKSPCRTSARRFSSSYLMEERSRNSYYVADLDCKVCHLHWSRAGVARVFIDWNQQPVLLLATRLLANRDAKSFQYEKGAAYDRQQIQMGLRKGNTILIHYRRGSDLYQSVLIMQDADLKQGKVSPEQHKYWRYVAPVRSYFDWLPEKIANTFCSTALEAFAGRQYGELEHVEEMDNPRFANMCFQNIYHIGDTKSGQELNWFPHWWPKGELSGFTAGWTRYPVRGSLWTSYGCAYSSQVSVCHLGTTWHERTPWGCYCHRVPHVWGWACVQGPS